MDDKDFDTKENRTLNQDVIIANSYATGITTDSSLLIESETPTNTKQTTVESEHMQESDISMSFEKFSSSTNSSEEKYSANSKIATSKDDSFVIVNNKYKSPALLPDTSLSQSQLVKNETCHKSSCVQDTLLPENTKKLPQPQQLSIDSGNKDKPLNARQIVCLAAVASCTIGFSFMLSWSAVLPKIEEDTTHFTITKEDVSWLVSITSVVGVITALFAGSLVELLGPRKLMLIAILPMAPLWLMMAFTPYLSLLYVGRAGIAMCCCFTNICTQPLVAELCPPKIRGFISSSSEIVGASGILVGYILAQSLPWKVATAVSAIPVIPLFFIILFVVPESPYWLIRHNKREEAERSLQLMLGPGIHVAQQLEDMASSSKTKGSLKKQVLLLRKKAYAVPILLLWLLFVLREFGGKTALSSYSVYMFRQAEVRLDPFVCTVLLGLIRVVGHIISALTMDRLGRKPFLIGSSLTCGLCMGISGIFLWFELPGRSWVCLTMLLLFIVAFGLGAGPIPWLYLGELLPTPVRHLGASFVILTYNSASFTVNYLFFKMLTQFGIGLTIAFFAIPNLLMLAVTILWLPETKGRSLDDLERSFRKRM